MVTLSIFQQLTSEDIIEMVNSYNSASAFGKQYISDIIIKKMQDKWFDAPVDAYARGIERNTFLSKIKREIGVSEEEDVPHTVPEFVLVDTKSADTFENIINNFEAEEVKIGKTFR